MNRSLNISSQTTEKISLQNLMPKNSNEQKRAIINDLSHDLLKYLEASNNKDKKLLQLSRTTGLNLKTLKRLINKENKPTPSTLVKIYKELLGSTDIRDIIERAPKSIAQVLKQTKVDTTQIVKGNQAEVENYLVKNQLALTLFILASLSEIKQQEIKEKFGTYGLSVMEDMLKMGMVYKPTSYSYSAYNLLPFFNSEMLKLMGLNFVEKFYDSENSNVEGFNHISFYAQSLKPEAYQKWLKIDLEAYLKKREIAENPKNQGSIKAFSFTAVDKVTFK